MLFFCGRDTFVFYLRDFAGFLVFAPFNLKMVHFKIVLSSHSVCLYPMYVLVLLSSM